MMWPFGKSRRALEREIGRIVLSNPEARAALENPRIELSSPRALAELFGYEGEEGEIVVTPQTALGCPPVWCAVNFITGTFAALPAPVYRHTDNGREKADNHPVYALLHDWVNDDYLTSFAWRKYSMMNTLLLGRSFTFIERNKAKSKVMNLWPLEPDKVTVERINGRRRYKYRDGSREVTYQNDEVIDVPFLMQSDNLSAVDPIATLKQSLYLTLSLERYASRFFNRGGVPPLALQMPEGSSPDSHQRASADIQRALDTGSKERKLILPMPAGHRLDKIAFNPDEGQLTEARKHQLRDVARMFGLPPVFLQDLEFGTFSNTEQQDLILVKHTLTQWLRCWEQELNAKLFGPRSPYFIEFNVDGLLRGDFKTRMEGYSKAIQNALMTPNYAADLENRPRSTQPEADLLHIQGATVPLGQQTKATPVPTSDDPNPNEPDEGESADDPDGQDNQDTEQQS